MKPYPKYKDSGIEWIGEIPEHWETKPLKYLLKDGQEGIKIGPFGSALKLEMMKPDGHKVYGQENIINDDFSAGTRYIDDNKFNEMSVYRIKPNDIVVTMMGTTGKSKIIPEGIQDGIIDSHLIRMGVNEDLANPHFISALINDSYYIFTQIKQNSKGSIMEGLNSSIIKSLLIAFPPTREQKEITQNLDRKTRQIDELIEKKRRMIELLKEQRTAIINHAVTKGLNPNAPMKDSGIEWLGEIPAHWEAKRIKWIAKMESGHTPNKQVPEYWENCDIPWVSLNDSRFLAEHDYISETKYCVNELGLQNSSARLLPKRAVVFTRDATVGLTAITTKPMAVSQHLIAWLCSEGLIPEYLLYVFYAMEDELNCLKVGTTIKTIGMPEVREMVTPYPPLSEQDVIIAYLKAKLEKISEGVIKEENSIELLQEYRTALISNAVTGKIDVREEN